MDLTTYVNEKALFGRHGWDALERRCQDLFGDVDFAGKDVLEIGAGDGILSLWLLYRGARSVVSLEPEMDGHTGGAASRAQTHRAALGIDEARWDYRPDTFQQYAPDRDFALVVSQASVNHLDEDACMRLGFDPAARGVYLSVFEKLRNLMATDGRFVCSDVGRVNLWPVLGRPSPWAPEIEWDKHQEPELWCDLLRQAGLEPLTIRWQHPFFRIKALGPLLGNRLASRCLGSQFAITARRP